MTLVPKSFRVLRHPQLRLVVLGNVVSQLGTWSQYVGVGWAATRLSDSKVVLGLAFAAPFAASLFLSPIAGVLADRYDRRKQVMLGNVAMAVPPFIVGLMLQRGVATVPWLLGLVFLGGVAQALTQPASMALVPHLVPEDEVQQAVALSSGLVNMTRVIGPGIGGFAIDRWGVGWAFHLNAVSFFAVVVAWWFVRVPHFEALDHQEPFVRRLRSGVRYARHNPAVGRVLLLIGAVQLFVMHAPLMPLFATDVLHGDASTYAALAAGPGIGAIFGALIAGELTGGRARRLAMGFTSVAAGLALVAFSQSRVVALSVFCLAVFGVVHFTLNALVTTTVITASEDEYRGRVLGLLGVANAGLIPLNAVLAGVLASVFGPVTTVAGAGACMALISAWFFLSGKLAGVDDTGASRVAVVDDPVLDAGVIDVVPATGL